MWGERGDGGEETQKLQSFGSNRVLRRERGKSERSEAARKREVMGRGSILAKESGVEEAEAGLVGANNPMCSRTSVC